MWFLVDIVLGLVILYLSRKAVMPEHANELSTRSALFDAAGWFIGLIILAMGVAGFIHWL